MMCLFLFVVRTLPFSGLNNFRFFRRKVVLGGGISEVSSPMILTGYGALNKLLGKWLGLCRPRATSCAVFVPPSRSGGLEEVLRNS